MRSRWDGRERFLSGDTVNRLEEDIRVSVDFICSTLPECIVTLSQLIAAAVFLSINGAFLLIDKSLHSSLGAVTRKALTLIFVLGDYILSLYARIFFT